MIVTTPYSELTNDQRHEVDVLVDSLAESIDFAGYDVTFDQRDDLAQAISRVILNQPKD